MHLKYASLSVLKNSPILLMTLIVKILNASTYPLTSLYS